VTVRGIGPDRHVGDDQPCDRWSGRRSMRGMKKLLMLGALAALVAVAVRKVRSI